MNRCWTNWQPPTKKQEELRQTVERQQCYISGLEYALRHMTPTVVVESHEKEAKEKAG